MDSLNLPPSTSPVNDNRYNRTPRRNKSRHKRPTLFHGCAWGRWVFDAERLVLVLDGQPGTGGAGADQYMAYFGIYEVDVELRASSQLLDRIFQVLTLGWVDAKCMSDFLRALDDILKPQANLCSAGCDKRIEKPAEFLRARIRGEQRRVA
jgi:hypothetical protein